MTTARRDIATPFWPRGLRLEQAAAYVGLSPSQFRKEWEIEKKWPDPVRRGRIVLWDRLALDARFDELSGMASARPGRNANFSRRLNEWQNQRS